VSYPDATEYAARLAFKRNLHETFENAHRAAREVYDAEINRVGAKLGLQEAEKKESPKQSVASVPEVAFTILKFEDVKSERLTDLQTALKSNNLPDRWSTAYNILRQNNALIQSRYHGASYQFSYWLYGEDRIFRQPLKRQ